MHAPWLLPTIFIIFAWAFTPTFIAVCKGNRYWWVIFTATIVTFEFIYITWFILLYFSLRPNHVIPTIFAKVRGR